MMIKIKTESEIELIKKACQIVTQVIVNLSKYISPGVCTRELDQQAEEMLRKLGATAAFKRYRGYPANICTSINEEVVHGIPGKRRLRQGDIISVDVGAKLNGYFGDVACTFAVREVCQTADQLLQVSKQALFRGIEQAKAGNCLYNISSAIQSYVESFNFSVVRKFVGHGIGKALHEEPEIPNFGKSGSGPILKAGMVLAIEPMVNAGTFEVEILKDKWTAVTKDRRPSAHFEHTVLITKNGPEVLTAWE